MSIEYKKKALILVTERTTSLLTSKLPVENLKSCLEPVEYDTQEVTPLLRITSRTYVSLRNRLTLRLKP